ncbi:ROK family protein [Salinispira pacifica]
MSRNVTVGIDIGGTSIKAVVLGTEGAEGRLVSVPTPSGEGSAGVIGAIELAAERALESAGGAAAVTPKAFGVGTPGLVDDELTIRGTAVNLPEWEAFSLKAVLEERFGVPVWGGNDVGLAVLGEYELGAGRDADVLAGIWLGTGIGGGIVIGGRPFRGHNGIGSEVGHLVVEPQGELCRCGQRGCAELYASATGFLALYRQQTDRQLGAEPGQRAGSTLPSVTLSEYALALRSGKPEAVAAHETATEMLARAVGIVINLFAPDRLVLGGGVVQAGVPLLEAVGRKLPHYALSACRDQCELRLSTLGAEAGPLGAALLARRRSSGG